jgi:hypothetical protein
MTMKAAIRKVTKNPRRAPHMEDTRQRSLPFHTAFSFWDSMSDFWRDLMETEIAAMLNTPNPLAQLVGREVHMRRPHMPVGIAYDEVAEFARRDYLALSREVQMSGRMFRGEEPERPRSEGPELITRTVTGRLTSSQPNLRPLDISFTGGRRGGVGGRLREAAARLRERSNLEAQRIQLEAYRRMFETPSFIVVEESDGSVRVEREDRAATDTVVATARQSGEDQ